MIPCWKRLKKSGAQIEAVATDMGPAYISAVKANLPEAILMFDHFHIIKLFNEKLTKLRRDLQREAENGPDKLALKGTLAGCYLKTQIILMIHAMSVNVWSKH